jgi:tetratricopeptide (TPR) repeat protein
MHHRLAVFAAAIAVALAVAYTSPAWGQLAKGDKAKPFVAYDIKGRAVNLEETLNQAQDLVVLFFFTVEAGDDIALRLRLLDKRFGKEKLQVIAVGFKEDEEALKQFAEDMDIDYYILPDAPDANVSSLYGPITVLPLVFMISPELEGEIVGVLKGGGGMQADVLNKIAMIYLRKQRTDEARTIAEEAKKAGEDPKEAATTIGFALTQEGKLDEAAEAFGAIDYKEGLATIALEKGQYEEAVDLASQAPADSGYADTVKGVAYVQMGDLETAAKTFDSAVKKTSREDLQSDAYTWKGRLEHELGHADKAIESFHQAQELDPLNVKALSDEGATQRDKGNLDQSAKVLQKAQKLAQNDSLVAMMLQQVQQELEERNDIARAEHIRQTIDDLVKRYKEQQAADDPVDTWTTRPLILAFLPAAQKGGVFFERAGTDVVIRREIENRLRQDERIQVVDREMLDKLLGELNLGSSELADADTQLRLGNVLAAQLLGFVDFAQVGNDAVMYIRLVNTETTAIENQVRRGLDDQKDLNDLISGVTEELVAGLFEERHLQGLIEDASSGDRVIINLGKRHGVEPGRQFSIIQEGEPIVVNGKEVGKRPKVAGMLEVTEVGEESSVCNVVQKAEGVQLAARMKVKEPPNR